MPGTVCDDPMLLDSDIADQQRVQMLDRLANANVDPDVAEQQMNTAQKRVYRRVIDDIAHLVAHKENKCQCGQAPKSINLFVTGVAGTGKTFLINAIIAKLVVVYVTQAGTADVPVCVGAPTGVAAFPLGGRTLHSLFALGTQHGKGEAKMPSMGAQRIKLNQVLFRKLKLLIIDEISMVSNVTLAKIHYRMHEWFPENDGHFGDISVLAFGDFLQLPPVDAQYVFESVPAAVAQAKLGAPCAPPLWRAFVFEEFEPRPTNYLHVRDHVDLRERRVSTTGLSALKRGKGSCSYFQMSAFVD